MIQKELWTNSSPSTTFASQTINIDLSEYQYIILSFYRNAADGRPLVPEMRAEVGTNNAIWATFTEMPTYATCEIYGRIINISTSAIAFSVGYRKATYSSTGGSTDNNVMVPYKIYGIKIL